MTIHRCGDNYSACVSLFLPSGHSFERGRRTEKSIKIMQNQNMVAFFFATMVFWNTLFMGTHELVQGRLLGGKDMENDGSFLTLQDGQEAMKLIAHRDLTAKDVFVDKDTQDTSSKEKRTMPKRARRKKHMKRVGSKKRLTMKQKKKADKDEESKKSSKKQEDKSGKDKGNGTEKGTSGKSSDKRKESDKQGKSSSRKKDKKKSKSSTMSSMSSMTSTKSHKSSMSIFQKGKGKGNFMLVPDSSPTSKPTDPRTLSPTSTPTSTPTMDPTFVPTMVPTFPPSKDPTTTPSSSPSDIPSSIPTATPSLEPDATFSGPTLNDGQPINLIVSDGSVKLRDEARPFNFIWIAVSGLHKIVKVDTQTGEILGEYRSGPVSAGSGNPSRTTVDSDGSLWVANRNHNPGTVLHIGLEENNQCEDRNGNGVIETSMGEGDLLSWPDETGIRSVTTAQDECILSFTRVSSSGTRHLTLDPDNNLWVSGTSPQNWDLIQGGGVTTMGSGSIIESYPSVGFGGYGGLIDASGILWSARPFLRWNTSLPLTGPNGDPSGLDIGPPASGTSWSGSRSPDTYGLCIDSRGNIWATQRSGGINKFSPDGVWLGRFGHGNRLAQGCVVGIDDDVYVAHGLGSSSTVGRIHNNGTFVGNIAVGIGPTGVSVDGDGKIWSANYNAGTLSRIDPTLDDGKGAVDLTVPLGSGSLPYNYGDMTGSTLSSPPQSGTWSVVFDSEQENRTWGVLNWAAETPSDSSIVVQARSSTDGVTFSAYETATALVDLTLPNGRYLEVRAILARATTGESPSLFSLFVLQSTGEGFTEVPTKKPSQTPSSKPSMSWAPSSQTNGPTLIPTSHPTFGPTAAPTELPTAQPTTTPTNQPTSIPSSMPTEVPANGQAQTGLSLQLSTGAITAGDSIMIIPILRDDDGMTVRPLPSIVYEISLDEQLTNGTIPGVFGSTIDTFNDTRGVYMITGTVDGTHVSASEIFVVFQSSVESESKARYSRFSTAVNGVSRALNDLQEVVLPDNSVTSVPDLQQVLDNLRSAMSTINLVEMRFSTLFAPEQGWLPSLDTLVAAGFLLTTDDASLQTVLGRCLHNLQDFSSALETSGTATELATLDVLNQDFDTFCIQEFEALSPTVHGWVKELETVNYLFAVAMPRFLFALVNTLEGVILAQGLGFTRHLTSESTARQYPVVEEEATQRNLIFLVDFLFGFSTAAGARMFAFEKLYYPVVRDVVDSAAILALGDLLEATFPDALAIEAVNTNSFFSLLEFGRSGSTIEVIGANRYPERNLVLTVGTAVITQARSILKALNPAFKNVDEAIVWSKNVGGIIDSVIEGNFASEVFNMWQEPDSVRGGCLISANDKCMNLVYDSGFDIVNVCNSIFCVGQPVLFYVQNLDNGSISFGEYAFRDP